MITGWIVDYNGTKYHYVNDILHNDDGPAVIGSDGHQTYYHHGKLHRVGGPAYIEGNGYQAYYQNEKPHREDGPAIIYSDGRQAYYLFGEKVTKEHLAILGLDDYPENGFSKDQVMMFTMICMDEQR